MNRHHFEIWLRERYGTQPFDSRTRFQFQRGLNLMSDFRSRLMEEYSGLQIRLEKLKDYILTPAYDTLPEIDRKDLKAQLVHMQGYHDVLSRRVSRLCNNA